MRGGLSTKLIKLIDYQNTRCVTSLSLVRVLFSFAQCWGYSARPFSRLISGLVSRLTCFSSVYLVPFLFACALEPVGSFLLAFDCLFRIFHVIFLVDSAKVDRILEQSSAKLQRFEGEFDVLLFVLRDIVSYYLVYYIVYCIL